MKRISIFRLYIGIILLWNVAAATNPDPILLSQTLGLSFHKLNHQCVRISLDSHNLEADGYLTIRKVNGYPEEVPQDGSIYLVGDKIGTGQVIYAGDSPIFEDKELKPLSEYFYVIYPFNYQNGSVVYLTNISIRGRLHTTSIFPGLIGQQLLDSLIAYYKPATVLNYDQARDTLFAVVFNHDDSLTGVYSGFTVYLDPHLDPTIDAFNKGINTEHAWPQSKGAVGNARSDMHHLFPARAIVNSSRGNAPFDEIPDSQTDRWYRNDIVTTNIPAEFIDEYSEKDNDIQRFEPREDQKGNIARAMFYFYTMYRQEAIAADPSYFDIQKEVLLHWHYLDPIDSLEILRDIRIANYQEGKRNPFILDTSLVRRAYFEEDNGDTLTPEVGDIIITEIMQNPDAVADNQGEWFEIYNTTTQTIDMNGWIIKDFDNDRHTITNNGPLLIQPHSFLVLGNHSDSLSNGGVQVDYQYSGIILANGADEILLYYKDGSTEIDRVIYDGGISWPDPTGATMVFVGHPSEDNNDPSYWSTATQVWPGGWGEFGSPGFQGPEQVVSIDLTAFFAEVAEQKIILNWATRSETDNLGWEIFRKSAEEDTFHLLASYEQFPELQPRVNVEPPVDYIFADTSVELNQTYLYKLANVDLNHIRRFHGLDSITFKNPYTHLPRPANDQPGVFRLYPNFPNPFNSRTIFPFEIPANGSTGSKTKLTVYNLIGQEVCILVDAQLKPGQYQVEWNGRTEQGIEAPSGIYFAMLKNGTQTHTVKLILIR